MSTPFTVFFTIFLKFLNNSNYSARAALPEIAPCEANEVSTPAAATAVGGVGSPLAGVLGGAAVHAQADLPELSSGALTPVVR